MKKSVALTLQNLVLEILAAFPEGLNHVQLVKLILNRGYQHPEGHLSEDTMKIVKFLTEHGLIKKNLETRKIYQTENNNPFGWHNNVSANF